MRKALGSSGNPQLQLKYQGLIKYIHPPYLHQHILVIACTASSSCGTMFMALLTTYIRYGQGCSKPWQMVLFTPSIDNIGCPCILGPQ